MQQSHRPHLFQPVENFRGADFFKSKEMFEACAPAKDQLKRALELRISGIG